VSNITKEKSFALAVRVVKLYKHLTQREKEKEFILSKQLLRSGTSVGANIREANNAESTADFIHKLAIAQKECDESCYWLELLYSTNYITEQEFKSIYQDFSEMLKIIRSIILTKKQKNHKSNVINHKS
jgi:four helix bundle protein